MAEPILVIGFLASVQKSCQSTRKFGLAYKQAKKLVILTFFIIRY